MFGAAIKRQFSGCGATRAYHIYQGWQWFQTPGLGANTRLHPLILTLSYRSSELASKLKLLEGKLLHGEQRGGLDRLAQEAAAQLSWQQAELRKQRAAEAEAARRIAALEANAQAVQTDTLTLQVGAVALW